MFGTLGVPLSIDPSSIKPSYNPSIINDDQNPLDLLLKDGI